MSGSRDNGGERGSQLPRREIGPDDVRHAADEARRARGREVRFLSFQERDRLIRKAWGEGEATWDTLAAAAGLSESRVRQIVRDSG